MIRNFSTEAQEIAGLVASYRTETEVKQAGYEFGWLIQPGMTAVVHSHGRYRRGKVVKVGRTRATVQLTTETAIREALDPNFGWTEPHMTNKNARLVDIAVESQRQETAA